MQICKFCSKEMRKDDTDFRFEGHKDVYWVCDNCNASCFERIRYGKSISKEFNRGE